jgi:hypothetical protein
MSSLLTVALGLSLGQVPYQSNGSYSPGAPVGAETGLQATANGGQYGHEEMYPYDAYDNWVHGHFQEIPAYGGYHFFRPYNYKHVLSQSQTSGGWGNSPQLPYSHEYFWRRSQQAGGQAAPGYGAPVYGSPYQSPNYTPPHSHVPGVGQPSAPVYSQPVPVMPAPGFGPTTGRLSVPSRVASPVEYGETGPAMIDSAVYQGPADPRQDARRQLFQGPALRTR